MVTDKPNYESACYKRQLDDMTVSRDCFEGEASVMAKSRTYLPQYSAENDKKYDARLASSVFWEATRKAVYSLSGLVFRKDPVLGEDVPAVIVGSETSEGLRENIDNAGTAFDVFAKEILEAAIVDGHTLIYTDMPLALPAASTRADEIASKRRPYWVHYRKDQLINLRTQSMAGKTILTQATIKECLMIPDGEYGEKEVTRYRVLRSGEWYLYEEQEVENSEEKKIVLIEEGKTSLNRIPLVPVYANKTGFFESRPPLLGLAKENLRHYRLQSSLDNIMTLCNIPLLTLIGRNSKDPVTIGYALDIPMGANAKFVEPEGSAIKTTQQELDRSKANMASLSLSVIMGKPDAKQTATEMVLDFAGETSELSTWARALEDGLEQALMDMAAYLGEASGGSVEVNKEFTSYNIPPQMFTAMVAAVEGNIYPLDWFWNQLERANLIPADADKEQAKMDLETAKRQQMDLGSVALDNFNRNLQTPPIQ